MENRSSRKRKRRAWRERNNDLMQDNTIKYKDINFWSERAEYSVQRMNTEPHERQVGFTNRSKRRS